MKPGSVKSYRTMSRRSCLKGAAALSLLAAGLLPLATGAIAFEIEKTPEDWRKLLTAEQYRVLRRHGTERPFSSPLDKEYRKGTFVCAGCELPLFSSKTKYDSRTGWPSFFRPLKDAIGTSTDKSLGMTRIEVHCRRCGGHLVHVFDDGPPPTGKRYCMNGVAMNFIPAKG